MRFRIPVSSPLSLHVTVGTLVVQFTSFVTICLLSNKFIIKKLFDPSPLPFPSYNSIFEMSEMIF